MEEQREKTRRGEEIEVSPPEGDGEGSELEMLVKGRKSELTMTLMVRKRCESPQGKCR